MVSEVILSYVQIWL